MTFRLFIWMTPLISISLAIARFWLHPGGSGWFLDGVIVVAIVITIAMGVMFLSGRASKDLNRSLYSDKPEASETAEGTRPRDPGD